MTKLLILILYRILRPIVDALEEKINWYEDDPEIMKMSEQERIDTALSAFGSWADRDDLPEDFTK